MTEFERLVASLSDRYEKRTGHPLSLDLNYSGLDDEAFNEALLELVRYAYAMGTGLPRATL